MKKKTKTLLIGALILIPYLYGYAKVKGEIITFCYSQPLGPGVCIQNGESGYKCIPVNFEGDCNATGGVYIPNEEES